MRRARCLSRTVPRDRRHTRDARPPDRRASLRTCLLITSLCWGAAAHAGSLGHHDVVRLARTADVVALGVCLASDSAWDAQHRFIETTIRFQPTRSFKGTATGPLTIRVLGGQVGSEGMTASSSTTMAVHEEAVLFLRRSRFGTYYVVAGGPSGKLPVQRDPHTGRQTLRGPLSLDEFERLITTGAQ